MRDISYYQNLERDFYIIEEDEDGKWIHFEGFTWWDTQNNYDDKVGNFRSEEMTFCYVPVNEYSAERLSIEMEQVKQYVYYYEDEKAEHFVNHYFGNKDGSSTGGIHLPLRDVTEDTPCGFYWCYFEEE